jgi:hypothetical protein
MIAIPGFCFRVMPGLDPGIHQKKIDDGLFLISDGLPVI